MWSIRHTPKPKPYLFKMPYVELIRHSSGNRRQTFLNYFFQISSSSHMKYFMDYKKNINVLKCWLHKILFHCTNGRKIRWIPRKDTFSSFWCCLLNFSKTCNNLDRLSLHCPANQLRIFPSAGVELSIEKLSRISKGCHVVHIRISRMNDGKCAQWMIPSNTKWPFRQSNEAQG